MARTRSDQFAVVFPDGSRIDRLPVGLAVDRWWLQFVLSGLDFLAGRPPLMDRQWYGVTDRLRLEGPAGEITLPPSGAGCDSSVASAQYEFDQDLPWLKVSYLQDGDVVASEVVDLGPRSVGVQ